ncbi:MAG: trypsin-like serine protease [Myxococcales bacterium]|nr:trypsin-like serine protease [Myxococcales bacterium]
MRALTLVLFAALAASATQCASAPVDSGDETEDPIYGGSLDDSTNQAVVALRIGQGAKAELCSAAAIAPNVLLTARHCVSTSLTKTVICNSKGASENGPHFGDDHPVSDIRVYTGAKPNFYGGVAAQVREIVRPDAPVVCNQDIALLILDRNLDVTPLPVRLARDVGVQESIRSVGYGKTDTGTTGTRLRKTGVVVRAVGPGLSSSETALGDHEFEVGVSICHGDSGGPAISQLTGAVIGVVSRGGECGEDFGHVYTETKGFTELIERAVQKAGAAPAQPETESLLPASTPAAKAPAANADDKGGCAVGTSKTGRGHAASLAGGLLLGLAMVRRRRR